MRNFGQDETQAGIKIAGRNVNNLRYVDDTTLMAESEEELKSLLMKVKEFQKNIYLAFLTMAKPLAMWITINCGKFFTRWEYRLPDLTPEKSVCRSRSNS